MRFDPHTAELALHHPDELVHHVVTLLHGAPERMSFNQPGGDMFTTRRWIALRVPDGIAQVLWLSHPDFYEERWMADPYDRHPEGRLRPYVYSALKVLGRRAEYLHRTEDGRCMHGLAVFHPDFSPCERAHVVLVDLWVLGTELADSPDFQFTSGVLVHDRLTGRPLRYEGQKTPTPPGFFTVDRFLSESRRRMLRPAM